MGSEDLDFWSGYTRECRSRLGMLQKQFAHQLSVTRETVSRWEKGHELPSIVARRRLRELMVQARQLDSHPYL